MTSSTKIFSQVLCKYNPLKNASEIKQKNLLKKLYNISCSKFIGNKISGRKTRMKTCNRFGKNICKLTREKDGNN